MTEPNGMFSNPNHPIFKACLERYNPAPARAPRNWAEGCRSLHFIRTERWLRGAEDVRIPVDREVPS